jgi:hypothetical protein
MTSRRLKKPHDLIHIKSLKEYDGNDLKRDLHEILYKVISPIAPDLVIPFKLIDALLYAINQFGYPECIQMTRNNNGEINGEAVFIPNMFEEHLINDGRSDELRVGSGGWILSKEEKEKGKGYSKYHYTHFANMCKTNKVKKLLIGQINTENIKAIKSCEKFKCPIEYKHVLLEKNLRNIQK